jgi:hypothetical protein
MRIKEPTDVLTAMQLLDLEHDEDFAILKNGEREEMIFGLGAQGIFLGDRSKARHYFGALQQGDFALSLMLVTHIQTIERSSAPPAGCRTAH